MHIKLRNAKLPLVDMDLYYDLEIVGGIINRIDAHRERELGLKPFSFSHESEDGVEYDLAGRIVLPGLIDAHMHLDKSYSSDVVDNRSGTLGEAIKNYGEYSANFTKNNVKMRMARTVLSALKHGTTAIRTHIDFNTNLDEESTFRGITAALEVKEEFSSTINIQVFPMLQSCKYEKEDRRRIEKMLCLGVDGVGGAPHLNDSPYDTINEIFWYASKYDLPIDLHTDESDDPNVDTISYIANKTIEKNYQGRVVVDHLCSLAAMEEKKLFIFYK